MTGMLAIRRGLGIIYILSGLVHGGEMNLATLYSMGRLHVILGLGIWSELYFAHFLVTVGGGGLYLFLSYKREETFYPEPLIDFVLGVAVFEILMSGIAWLLVRQMLSPWWSLLPSVFLLVYGYELYQGRRFGVPAENP